MAAGKSYCRWNDVGVRLSIHDMLGSKLREANVVKEVWKQFRVGAIVVNCCMLAPGLLMVIWPGFLP